VQPGGDLHSLARYFGSQPGSQAGLEVIRLWRDCEQLTAALRPAIDALAENVLERGELRYPEASETAAEAMAGLAMPTLPHWLA